MDSRGTADELSSTILLVHAASADEDSSAPGHYTSARGTRQRVPPYEMGLQRSSYLRSHHEVSPVTILVGGTRTIQDLNKPTSWWYDLGRDFQEGSSSEKNFDDAITTMKNGEWFSLLQKTYNPSVLFLFETYS